MWHNPLWRAHHPIKTLITSVTQHKLITEFINNLNFYIMDIIGNYKNVLTKKYSDFKGRAGRTEYWLFVLVNVAISIVYQILVSVSGDNATARVVISAIFGLFFLAILVPGLAISVRRMHDIGKGGEWFFINFIPVIGGIWFLVLCIKEGEPTANRFGEPQP